MVLGGLLAAAPAAARPPACFPERTVLWAAPLHDPEGRPLGGVRAGQMVHVLDDAIGPRGDQALIEVRAPVVVRGIVQRDRLLAFSADEIPIEPDWSWWLAGAPLWLLEGDAKSARINRAEPHGELSSFPDVTVACGKLTARPLARLHHDACRGASFASPSRRAGQPVHWEAPVVITGPAGQRFTHDGGELGLLRRTDDRVLVDMVHGWDDFRVRGWAPAAGMKPVAPGYGYGRGHACCEGTLYLPREGEGQRLRLARAATLHEARAGAAITNLPRGATVHALGRFHDRILVAYHGRGPGLAFTTIALVGWVSRADLASAPDLPAAWRGRVRFAGERAGAAVEVTIDGGHTPALAGRIEDDLAFEVPALAEDEARVGLVSADRRWWTEETVYRSVARDQEIAVTLRPAGELRGRVVTEDGLGIPGATVRLRGPRAGHAFPSDTTTNADGHFRLAYAPTRYLSLSASASGFSSAPRRAPATGDLVFTLRRRWLASAGVERRPDGACVEPEILADGQPVPVAADCRASVEWDADEAITLTGRRQRRPSLSLSAKGGSSTMSDCADGFDKPLLGPGDSDQSHCDVTGDRTDLCLTAKCDPPRQGSLFVRVVGPGGALAADARVTVRRAGEEIGTCAAPSGACFLHPLLDGPVVIEAQAPGGKAVPMSARLVAGPGVTELTVKIDRAGR